MTVPRTPATIAQRVKALEEALRVIKLVPSTVPSDVAPEAAVKGAVWIDSSAGNEPKVFDGTGWVPVRDETIAVAQTTADTAQATVDPLVPLTDLAAVTTGTTITGATNVTSDPGDGAHVVINDPAYPGQIALYSGNAGEHDPGLIKPVLGGANFGVVEIRSPDLVGTGQYAYMLLEGYDDSHTTMLASADNLVFEGNDDITFRAFTNPIKIGDGSDFVSIAGKVVTNADLSSLTNTFPTFPYYNAYLNATPAAFASGNITLTGWTADGSPNSSGITVASGIFTVPTTGRYRLVGQVWWPGVASGTGTRTAQVIKVSPSTTLVSHTINGSAVTTVPTPNRFDKTVRLSAGEQVFVRASHNSAVSTSPTGTTPDITYFQIEWVGP